MSRPAPPPRGGPACQPGAGDGLEELQSTNEELETTNEELQSTVEELETTNEELQSTNEELETMNEELQSTNEELQTINDEARERSDQLDELNAFLESILTELAGGVGWWTAISRSEWNRRAEDMWGLRPDEVRARTFSIWTSGCRWTGSRRRSAPAWRASPSLWTSPWKPPTVAAGPCRCA